MKNRNPLAVFFLSIITFGIYGIYWFVKTKGEMNAKGSQIPTAWLIIIPIVNWWWMWKYSEGVEKTTNEGMSAVISFILLFLLGSIGMAVIQNEFNKLGEAGAPAAPAPQAPVPPAPAAPVV
jgi:hypothetical protein